VSDGATISRRVSIAILLAISAALVAHSLYFDFVNDDAYISFVYSRNLAEHGQLVFNLGERVEGYTNFLWTVLLGVVMKIGVPPEVSSRVFGTIFGVAGLFVVHRFTARLRGRKSGWDLLAPALLAASSGYACWSSGGLETQMFTFFTILGAAAYLTEGWRLSGAAFALAAMTRPEGILVFGIAVLHRLVANLIAEKRILPTRGEWVWGLTFLALFVPYYAWRWWYYGWPFPNTFYVKAGGAPPPDYTAKMIRKGFYYVWQWATQSKAIYAVPLLVLGTIRRPRVGSFFLTLTIVYLVYTISVGGDFMGLHRFVMPLFVTTAILAALGLEQLADWASRHDRPLLAGAAGVIVVAFAVTQVGLSRASLEPKADNEIDRPGWLALYAHDRMLIGKALAPRMRPDDFSVVGGAGVQPYYARMRSIDIFGLVSEDIAHNEPPRRPRPGHQKWGSPSRILSYEPTFIFYCYDIHEQPDRYRLCSEARILERAGYEPVTIHVPGMKERGEYYTFLKRKDRPWP
jgi:hypothetical protein